MTVKNQPSGLQPTLIGVFTIVFTITSNRFIGKMDELSANVHQLNLNLVQVNAEVSSFNEWRKGKNTQDSEQDRNINQLQQTVGIIEERIKAKKDKR